MAWNSTKSDGSSTLPASEWNTMVTVITANTLDATLQGIAAVPAVAANSLLYTTGSDAFSATTISAYMRTVIDDADANTARSTLGLGSAALLQATAMGNLTVGTLTNPTMGSDVDYNGFDIKDLGIGSFKVYAHGNTGTSTTINWNNGAFQTATLTGNCTFTFTAPTVDANNYARLCLVLSQDGTGSRTATWPATVKWVGNTAATLTTTTSREDIITFIYNGTNYAAVASLNFDL